MLSTTKYIAFSKHCHFVLNVHIRLSLVEIPHIGIYSKHVYLDIFFLLVVVSFRHQFLWLSFSFQLYLLFISIGVDGFVVLSNNVKKKRWKWNNENFSHIFFIVATMAAAWMCVGDVIQSRLKCIFISYGSYKCFDMLEHLKIGKIPFGTMHTFSVQSKFVLRFFFFCKR